MRNLNDTNKASFILYDIANSILNDHKKDIIGVEMGIAYGGSVEHIGKLWNNNGIIYGFDTFEGHPKQVALTDETCNYSTDSFAATCMDGWYKMFDHIELTKEYQEEQLEKQNIKNVKLIKGLINEKTKIDFIPYINYCLLDLDFTKSMIDAFNLIENKMVKGGFLCLHDVIPKGHINGLNEWYEKIKMNERYEIVGEYTESYLAVLKMKY